MYEFSPKSTLKLRMCHPDLQELFRKVVERIDCTILQGHRTQAEQDMYFATGKSKVKWPDSKHNSFPSRAVDVAPYPIDWEDRERFTYFAGVVMGIAHENNIKVRWGGDWNMDNNLSNNRFDDLVHFELIDD